MQNEGYIEESIPMTDEARKKGVSKSMIFVILYIISISLAIVCLLLFIFSGFAFWFILIPMVVFSVLYFILKSKKDSCIMECDYILVENSLRIAKVLNGNSRKPLAVIECKDIISAGKIDTENFRHNLKSKEYTKIVATPNLGFSDDKIYYIIYNGKSNKNMLIFEPSSMLMLSISKVAKKNIFI